MQKFIKQIMSLNLTKEMNLIVFSISFYSSELNKVKNIFCILKNKSPFKNSNIKQIKSVVIEETQNLK